MEVVEESFARNEDCACGRVGVEQGVDEGGRVEGMRAWGGREEMLYIACHYKHKITIQSSR